MTDPRGVVTTYTYDVFGDLITKVEDDGQGQDKLRLTSHWTWDGNDNVLTETDPNNHTTTYEYNVQNFRNRKVDAGGFETLYTLDPVGNVLLVDSGLQTGAGGARRQTAFTYDRINRVLTEARGSGVLNLTTQYTYIAASCGCGGTPGTALVHSVVDPLGKVTYYYYDSLDRLIKTVRKVGVGDTADNGGDSIDDAITQYAYNTDGTLQQITYPENEQVQAGYDNAGRRTSITAVDPIHGNLNMTLGLDVMDNVTSASLPTGNQYVLTYDGAERMTQVTDSVGAVSALTYDANGNVLTRADGLGHTVTFGYDHVNRVTNSYDALVETSTDKYTTFIYDAAGNRTEVVDRNGVGTHHNYDARDLLTSTVEDYQGSGGTANTTTSYAYNGFGEVLTMADHNGNTTTYHYDGAGRRDSITYPDDNGQGAGVVTYAYDGSNHLTGRTDQKGVVTTYGYNDLYQVISRSYSTNRSESFSWNRSGKLLTANNDAVQLSFAYDALRRLSSTTQGFLGSPAASYTTTFDYTVGTDGSTRTTHYPGGRAVTDTFDKRNRLTAASGGTGIGATWIYDLANRRTNASMANGVIESVFSFDVNDRLTNVLHFMETTTLFDLGFEYDAEGVKKLTHDWHRSTISEVYSHDARQRLTSFRRGTLNSQGTAIATELSDTDILTGQSWSNLDTRGNWLAVDKILNGATTTQTRQANGVNEYTSVDLDGTGGNPPIAPVHDANGNLTFDPTASDMDHENNGDAAAPQRYTYDEENRLTRVVRDQDQQTLLEIIYDAMGRRIQSKNYLSMNGVLNPPEVTRHVYAGLKDIVEYSISGTTATLAREFIWGQTFTEPVAMVDWTSKGSVAAGTAEVFHYVTGPLGNVLGLVRSTGTIYERYIYNPYGRTYILASGGMGINGVKKRDSMAGNPFFWTGQRYDTGVQMYHCLDGTYGPVLGRWLQRDSLGYIDGVNLYLYCSDSPLVSQTGDQYRFLADAAAGGAAVAPSTLDIIADYGSSVISKAGHAISETVVIVDSIAAETLAAPLASLFFASPASNASELSWEAHHWKIEEAARLKEALNAQEMGRIAQMRKDSKCEEENDREHRKGKRKSTKDKHARGDRRWKRDHGNEKADEERRWHRKRPRHWTGPWPPKD